MKKSPGKRLPTLSGLGHVFAFFGWFTPLAVMGFLVGRYAVNVPHQDQWEMVPIFQHARSSGLVWSDFWALHNEHRIFFPQLAMFALARVSKWNIRTEIFVNFALGVAIFGVIFKCLRKTFTDRSALAGGVFVVAASIYLFSPVQWENWLLGYQIAWFLNLLSMLVAAAALWSWKEGQSTWAVFAVAAGAAAVGHFSLANGVLIWPACLPILLFRPGLRRLILPWVGVGAAATLLYFKNYSSPGSAESAAIFLHRPGLSAKYILYYLASPVLDSKPNIALGALLLAAFFGSFGYLALRRREDLEAASIWLAIGVFSLGTAILTAFGRVKFGLSAAATSRYTTVAILFMVASLAMLALALTGDTRASTGARLTTAAAIGGWGLVALLFLIDYPSELTQMKQWGLERAGQVACLQSARSADEECLQTSYPDKSVVFQRAQYLKSLGWGGLRP